MTRSSSRRDAPRSADDPTRPGLTAEPRAPSSASVRSSAASDSDTENAERPVRQQLMKATLGPAHKEYLPENHTMGEASDTAKDAENKPTEETVGQDAESNGKRGRVSRKRSFEDAETEKVEDLKVGKHSRKRSRDFTISGNEPEVTRRKTSGENTEQGSEEDKKTKNVKESANERAVTPEIAKEQGNAMMSPKNKRNREEFEEKEIPATSLSNNSEDAPKQDESDDASGPEGSERSELAKKAKRHRDSDNSQPDAKDKLAPDVKPAERKISPSSGFSNTSTVSPFGALTGNKPPPATGAPQTSESAFKASGFGAMASTPSPFAAMGAKPADSPFGTAAAGAKPAISGLSGSSSTSAFGGLSTSSEGKSSFAAAGSSGFGGLGGGLGGGFGRGFGGIGSGSKLGGFGGGSGPKITGLSDKPAKPFGAAAADDDDEGSGDDGDEEGNKSPVRTQQDEDPKDERFFEQNVETGEENEDTIFVSRAKLYIWNSDDARWQERAVGNLKVNVLAQSDEDKEAKAPKKARFIMRSDGSHRLALNSPIQKELKVGGDATGKKPVNKTVMFQGRLDEGEGLRTLSLKMKEENAVALWEKVTALQEEM